MRMHEDVRPFGCSLCDQTFRQKAHLQRHETTHGIGVKVTNRSGGSSNGAPRRKRKRSSRSIGSASSGMTPLTTSSSPPPMSVNLQQRLARVSEQFGTIKEGDLKDEDESLEQNPSKKIRRLSIRMERCEVTGAMINEDSGTSQDPTTAFQPYIATAEEISSANKSRTLNEAVNEAVNEAISDINEAMM